jgi:tRNA(fMet)-specific endonuclease VapC
MSRWILDTDTASLPLWKNPSVSRNVQSAGADVAISIVTVQELFNGWVVRINDAKSINDLLRWYEKFAGVVQLCKKVPVLPFDQAAATQLEVLLKANPALAKQRLQKDMRIAAIALANNEIVVTCNYRDFSWVPGLPIVDWSR